MIIAAHAGTGKTYFSKNVYDSVDFVCMPYKYYLPDGFIAEKESIVSLEIDEELLSEFNSIYAKTGYTFQTFARRELIRVAKSGEWPAILNKHELENE